MSPAGPVPPRMPVAVTCSCGKRIVLEPRWVGKSTACAACSRNFTVRMLLDPKTKRWSPHVTYAAEPEAQAAKRTWFTVACRCGHKIGLDSSFIGKTMTCKACQRQFTVKVVAAGDGHDTAILRYATTALPAPAAEAAAKPEPKRRAPTARGKTVEPPAPEAPPPPPPARPRAETTRGRTVPKAAPSDKMAMSPPPGEMHLLCVCGEELTVEKKYYTEKLCCGGCGTVMQLRLIFVPDRRKYELEARVVDPGSP